MKSARDSFDIDYPLLLAARLAGLYINMIFVPVPLPKKQNGGKPPMQFYPITPGRATSYNSWIPLTGRPVVLSGKLLGTLLGLVLLGLYISLLGAIVVAP
jgi:hypothetical protein